MDNQAQFSDGATVITANAVTALTASISNFVWADLDGDGTQDSGEPGLGGVRVFIDTDNDGVWDAGEPFDVTDAAGQYHIYDLVAGTYTVRTDPATYPTGYVPTTAGTLGVTLATGQQYLDADFGLQPPPAPGSAGRIGDTVWLDKDGDGVLDAGEAGIPGVTVKLYRDLDGDGVIDPTDPLVATDVTDASGLYGFAGLPFSATGVQYLVVVDESSSIASPYGGTSTLGAATDPSYDEDSGTGTPNGITPVTLASTTPHDTADFGYRWSGQIGDYVWYDTNLDADPDPGEPQIPGAFVNLYIDANGNGILDAANGDYQVAFAVTGADGVYQFTNLPPGPYLVDVYEDSITTDGVRDIVPTTSNVVYKSLGAGETYLGADFGYFQGARAEGDVFWDKDRNGVFDGGETGLGNGTDRVQVTLSGTDLFGNPITKSTTTDSGGHFFFLVPEGNYTLSYSTSQTTTLGYPDATTSTSQTFHAYPGEDWHPVFAFGVDNSGRIGKRVWNDADGDGLQDTGESGISGVTVALYAGDGMTLLAVTVTDATGNYLFPGLMDGSYQVKVVPSTLPAGFSQTYDNFAPTTDHTGTATVSGGGADLTADFGYRNGASYSVSGTVWDDNGAGGGTAGNGVRDGTEPGIPGVTVNLVRLAIIDGKVDINGDGRIDATDDGSYGGFTVTDGVLAAGAIGQTLNGVTVIDNGSGGGALDADGNGLADASDDRASAVVAATTTAASGLYEFLGVPNGDYLIRTDAATLPSTAYVQTGDPDPSLDGRTAIRVNGAPVTNQDFGYNQDLGRISGSVCDGNGNGRCDGGETGVAGVTVYLTHAGPDGILGTDDDLVTTAVTDSSGNYGFTDLQPGYYQVTKTNPAGQTSLADADGGNPSSISVNLGVGVDLIDRDFELQSASGGIGDSVWLDTDRDGVQDIGEPGLANVTVELAPAYAVIGGAIDVNGDGSITAGDNGWLRGIRVIGGELDTDGDGTITAADRGTFFGAPVIEGRLDLDGNGTADDIGHTGGDTLATEVTDMRGNYLFTSVPAGDYLVLVDEDTLPGAPGDLRETAGTANASGLITLGAGEVNLDADYGYVGDPARGLIGNFLWSDANDDGVQDGGEPGIGGVTLRLTNASGVAVDDPNQGGTQDYVVTTAADGSYYFFNLPPGTYKVEVTDTGSVLSGYTLTVGPQSGTDPTAAIQVGAGTIYDKADFGYSNPSLLSITDRTWYDANRNGIVDGAEVGIAGVTVDLVLDENGDGLTEYRVIAGRIDLNNDGKVDTSDDGSLGGYTVIDGFVDVNGTDPGFGDGSFAGYPVIDGVIDLNASGTTPPSLGGIGDLVWLDTNGDGVKNASEVGLSGVVVRLCSDASCTSVIATTTTNALGGYLFDGLAAGNYYVNVSAGLPTGLTGTSFPSGTTGQISLADGQTYTTADFGYKPATGTAVLGDRIWSDADGDGAQDAGEAGIGGVTVTLTPPAGVNLGNGAGVAITAITAADGSYLFTGIPADGVYDYTVTVTPPSGYAAMPTNNGGSVSYTLTDLSPGQVVSTADWGFEDDGSNSKAGSIGNAVFADTNGNGVQDAGEPGVSGVTLNLYAADGTTLIATTTTRVDGTYGFTGLPVTVGGASYVVEVSDTRGLLGNATQTADPDEPGVCATCDARGRATLTTASPSDDGLDFGFYTEDSGTLSPEPVIASTISGVDGEINFDGLPDGKYLVSISDNAGVLASVQGTTAGARAGETGVTVAGTDVVGESFGYAGLGPIGDLIFSDADGDGVQQPGETGIGGVTVKLYFDANDNGVLDSGTDTLLATVTTDAGGKYAFSDLPAGTFFVVVTPPAGYTQTGDPDATLDHATLVTLSATAPSYLDADFGYRNPALADVSGTVWGDPNKNAVIESGEPPFAGVTVALVDGSGKVVATTTTDASGHYRFPDVAAGGYQVLVTDAADILNGFFLTSGLDAFPVTVAGSDITGIDFGYARQTGTGRIGDSVWLDANGDGVRSPSEAGLSGVTLGLFSAGADGIAGTGDDVSLGTTVSDAGGTYRFEGLAADNYTVHVLSGVPANLTETIGTADPSALIALSDGQAYLDADFGYRPASGYAVLGDTVWYDVNGNGVQATGEVGIGGVKVKVVDEATQQEIAVLTTNPDGSWLAVIPEDATATRYVVFVDKSTLPGGLVTTPTNMGGGDTYIASVKAGDVRTNLDFGYAGGTPGRIGDAVFLDANGDGQWGNGEGLSGVTLTLARSASSTGPSTSTPTASSTPTTMAAMAATASQTA